MEMRRTWAKRICLLGIWFVLAGGVQAQLITIGFTATVTDLYEDNGKFGGAVQVGDAITGTYIYDTAVSDSNLSSTLGDYYFYNTPCEIQVNVGGLVFRSNPANLCLLVEIADNRGGNKFDAYVIHSYSNLSLPNETLVERISLDFNDSLGKALSSTALPITAPVLSDYQSCVLSIIGDCSWITADITSAYLVPEPVSIGLLVVGGFLLCRTRR